MGRSEDSKNEEDFTVELEVLLNEVVPIRDKANNVTKELLQPLDIIQVSQRNKFKSMRQSLGLVLLRDHRVKGLVTFKILKIET